MAFEDLLQDDASAILGAEFSETITYRAARAPPAGRIDKTISAVVQEMDTVGVGDEPRYALSVSVSKADISEVLEQRDEVVIRGEHYLVAHILTRDPGGWELYCVR